MDFTEAHVVHPSSPRAQAGGEHSGSDHGEQQWYPSCRPARSWSLGQSFLGGWVFQGQLVLLSADDFTSSSGSSCHAHSDAAAHAWHRFSCVPSNSCAPISSAFPDLGQLGVGEGLS